MTDSEDNDLEGVFHRIYSNREWRGGLSDGTVSGAGSTVGYTKPLRDLLPQLVRELNISSLLDAPCGDFHWMKHVEFDASFRYIGGDIVAPLVADLQRRYNSNTRLFVQIDVTKNPLPDLDMWMCRDCLFHLPFEDIFAALENFKRSKIQYLMATTHPNTKANTDIEVGGFRPLALDKPPFLLPTPLRRIPDGQTSAQPRELWVWRREQILGK